MTDKLVLYDLPSKDRCACWSLNPWKTRLALNYLGVDYETKWIEYPDLEPTFRAGGLAPNETGPAAYTIPTIRLPSGTLVQDSATIAPLLSTLYPSPPLHFTHPITTHVQTLVSKLSSALGPLYHPKVPNALLTDVSAEYFRTTRAERYGASLEEVARTTDVESKWQIAEEGARELSHLLRTHPEGPFFLGKEVCYADFLLVSMIQFFKRVEVEMFKRFVGLDVDGFGGLFEACGQWLARDAY